ncbi:MAG: DoxX family protein [Proteobacteria bacterium]|nr:DoxX family protein [Pseudomonadota bacterium]
MSVQTRIPSLVIPGLGRYYESLSGLAWPLVRATAGLLLVPHGAQKLFGWFGGGGLAGTAAFFSSNLGLEPGLFWALVVAITEVFGGLAIAVGFLTRPAALAVVALMAVAVFEVHLGAGFFWTQGGYEYPLMWGLIALAILFRGAGPHSVDERLGREI